MEKTIFVLIFIYTQHSIADICTENKNLKDYFLSIPAEMLMVFDDEKGPLLTKQEREDAIDIVDIDNGFISLQNKTIISTYEMSLYRSAEKKPVVLVTSDGVSVQNAYAFNCFGGKWHDVSNIIFPENSFKVIVDLYASGDVKIDGKLLNEKELATVAHTVVRYKLPRVGKIIQVYASHPDIQKPEKSILYNFEPAINELVWK